MCPSGMDRCRYLMTARPAIEKGEVVVVCGPSGSGKSTLIKTINALEPFQKGEIFVDGQAVHDPKTDLPKLRSRVGMGVPRTLNSSRT